MKRLVIFVFYDSKGIVDRYVEYLLSSLLDVSDTIIFVVNGKIELKSEAIVKNYTSKIFKRENKGFDAGAYKDAFLIYLENQGLEEYDEIILLNDTFYGPFYGWNKVFEEMKNQNVDFWGLSRHADSSLMLGGKIVREHIQGYFIVCKKQLFLSTEFMDFWINLCYPNNLIEAIHCFEIAFTQRFKELGYKFTSYVDVKDPTFITREGGNPYIDSYTILKNTEFPVIKRKVLSVYYFNQVKKAFQFIEENTNYNINMIYEHIDRLGDEGRITPFGYHEIREFASKHRKIYVYGRGILGKAVAEYLQYENLNFERFIVTENEDGFEDTMELKECADFPECDGIIIALRYKSFQQVYPHVMDVFCTNQILYPRFADYEKS